MSEPGFRGRAPRSSDAREFRFGTVGGWTEVHRCITTLVDLDLAPHPRLGDAACRRLADGLAGLHAAGLLRLYYELSATELASLADAAARTAFVDAMVEVTLRFASFLRQCGGCDAVL